MAYAMIARKSEIILPYLPISTTLKNNRQVQLGYYDKCKHEEEVYEILKQIIDDGDSYPQSNPFTIEDFRAYYTSYDTFACIDLETAEVLGAFYIKPNFPGRSSHICNGGFIVKKSCRGQGLGKFLASNYLYMAKDLGYKASFFNLVFATNKSAIATWRQLGFKEIGTIPKAGNLKGHGYTDALQFYYDLETLPDKK